MPQPNATNLATTCFKVKLWFATGKLRINPGAGTGTSSSANLVLTIQS